MRPVLPVRTGSTPYARVVAERLRTLELTDGRTLAYATWGDPEGFPILSLHGTPGCRFSRWPNEDVYASAGAYWVTHDRAGYGRSDRHHGRNVADEAADVAALADELGFDRFGVSGGSGGGPHVFACAALLPERVVRASLRRRRRAVPATPACRRTTGSPAWIPRTSRSSSWALAGEDVLHAARSRTAEAFRGACRRRSVDHPRRLRPQRVGSRADDAARGDAGDPRDRARAGRERRGGWVDDDLAFRNRGAST